MPITFGCIMGTKGGNYFRLKGKHLSITVAVIIGITILLWAWEKTPLITSLLSDQDQFIMPSSDILMGLPADPLIPTKPEEHIKEDSSDLVMSAKRRNEPNEEYSSDLKPRETESEQTAESFHIAPTDNASTSFHKRRQDDMATFSAENEDCNYAKGKWVADIKRPLYSGFGCQQWLSGMWACRLNLRKDFSYEGFRWQPDNCRMPEFERSKFLRRMQDKTIAFVGDSLARQQFQSLMCMASGGLESPEVEDIGGKEYGLVKARGAKRPDGWAYRFPSTNTTILFYWSSTLCDTEPLNATYRATDYAMHLDRPVAFLRTYLHRFDVLTLNTGHHWNRGKLVANRWVMYKDGMPNTDKKLAEMGNAKNFTIHSVVKWLESQLPHHPRLKAFLRTISPRHFFNGDWNTGGSCDNTTPLARGSEVSQDVCSDPVVENAVKNSKVKILDITAISELRDEGHISRYTIRPVEGMQDCLHWCLPGIPDTWNELLVAQSI